MIKPVQIVLIVLGLVLALGLYYFADLKGPAKEPPAAMQGGHTNGAETSSFDFAMYKEGLLNKLPSSEKATIKDLEAKVAKTDDLKAKKDLLNQLIEASEKNKLEAIACMYSRQIAEAENTAAAWDKTGDNFSETYGSDSITADVRPFLIQNAQESYQKALELAPNDTDTKIKLAGTYMDGGQQPMAGVSILLDIVKQDSNNVRAQFILGRYGIVSGQFDKAVVRLSKVTQLDPKNTDAWFYLGQAYSSLGQKEKAIESFEKCKSMMDDPEVQAQIDAFIEKIKNS